MDHELPSAVDLERRQLLRGSRDMLLLYIHEK
jgi:hypothetical protein